MKQLLRFLGALATSAIVIAMLLLACALCHAQTQVTPYIQTDLGMLDGLGYQNPTVSFEAGTDVLAAHAFVRSYGAWEWERKIETGNGSSFGANFSAYWRADHLLVGAGDSYTKLTTSAWTKSAQSPFASLGYLASKLIFLGSYRVPWLDHQNALQGFETEFDVRAASKAGLWLVLGDGVYFYHDTRVAGVNYGGVPAQYHPGAAASLGLRLTF